MPHHVSPSLVATLDTCAYVTFAPRVCKSKVSSWTERRVVSQKREAEGWTWGCGREEVVMMVRVCVEGEEVNTKRCVWREHKGGGRGEHRVAAERVEGGRKGVP